VFIGLLCCQIRKVRSYLILQFTEGLNVNTWAESSRLQLAQRNVGRRPVRARKELWESSLRINKAKSKSLNEEMFVKVFAVVSD